MEKEGFGEEFSICSAVFFWRNSGGQLFIAYIFFGIGISKMETVGFGEEFSICSSFCLGGIRGGIFGGQEKTLFYY